MSFLSGNKFQKSILFYLLTALTIRPSFLTMKKHYKISLLK